MSPKQRVARRVRAPRAACWSSGQRAARASAPLLLGVHPIPVGGSTHCTRTRCLRAARRSPPSRTPPRCSLRRVLLHPVARRSALLLSALSHLRPVALRLLALRPVARRFRRVRLARFRPVALFDVSHSAPSLSTSLDSAALLLNDTSHSNLRAMCDSVECTRSAPPRKKLRVLDLILPPSALKSYALTTIL